MIVWLVVTRLVWTVVVRILPESVVVAELPVSGHRPTLIRSTREPRQTFNQSGSVKSIRISALSRWSTCSTSHSGLNERLHISGIRQRSNEARA